MIIENETVFESVTNDKQRNGSRSESEEQSTLSKHAMSDMDIPSKLSSQHISTVGRNNKTEQVCDNELSLPPL